MRDHGISEDFALPIAQAINKQNPEPRSDEKVQYTVTDLYNRYGERGHLANYWSYGTDILEIGIINNKFYMESNPLNKVYVRAQAFTDEEKSKTYNHLVTVKHIPHLARVNFVGDLQISESYYKYSFETAELDVHYSAIAEKIQDNQFIEEYLDRLFGRYKDFVKEWLAVYCYTNYTKLPFLILTGPRGSGKNTFAEMVAEIYPTMSTMWHGEEKAFNPEVEMKLLIADETLSHDPKQYKTLKKHSGQKDVVVNHKYLKPYKVRNNMNIVILSNADRPIEVEADEIPTSPENNQFFVFRVAPFQGAIDTELREKLTERLGHYIRTELKQVYVNLNKQGNRYTVKVPITSEERALFVNNITDIDLVIDRYIDKMIRNYTDPHGVDSFKDYFDKKHLLHDFFEQYSLPWRC